MSDERIDGLEGLTAPVLDDIEYSGSSEKKGAPKGVSKPILDDMDDFSYTPSAKKGNPTGVEKPVLDDMSDQPAKKKENIISDDEIIAQFSPEQKEQFYILPPEKKKMVLDFRRKQISETAVSPQDSQVETEPEIKAPVLDETEYIPTEKKHEVDYDEPLTAPVLDEAPKTPEYVPQYAEDLEEIKREAIKKSAQQLAPNQKDEKESLKMMQQLREERERNDAEKGFKLTIIVAIIGVISAVLFTIFASGNYFGLVYQEEVSGKATEIVSQYSIYISLAVGLCSLLLITGIKAFKKLATTVFLFFTIIMLFPGIVMLTQKDGNMSLNVIIYALSIITSGYTFFSLTSNEKIGLYFSKKY